MANRVIPYSRRPGRGRLAPDLVCNHRTPLCLRAKARCSSAPGDPVKARAVVIQMMDSKPVFLSVWEYREALPSRNNFSEATFFWKSEPGIDTPVICLTRTI
jgi:hypothetical protein